MRRALGQALAEAGTQWFFLALALVFLSWPLLSLLAEGDLISVLARFLWAWIAGLGLLVALSRAINRRDTPR